MSTRSDFAARRTSAWRPRRDRAGLRLTDAVLCVDAIQFAEEPDAAYRELKRVLAPGGRAVLTCWEAGDRED